MWRNSTPMCWYEVMASIRGFLHRLLKARVNSMWSFFHLTNSNAIWNFAPWQLIALLWTFSQQPQKVRIQKKVSCYWSWCRKFLVTRGSDILQTSKTKEINAGNPPFLSKSLGPCFSLLQLVRWQRVVTWLYDVAKMFKSPVRSLIIIRYFLWVNDQTKVVNRSIMSSFLV